ncbi:hypothetical protein C0Q70_21147 [Pomacea canaliculata]|uniref:Uncharacterized protein n=1 Tax=Pomacea canaliculata TaxID=400727 RepID=A0A2T7NBQ5_POMCA|nr:hypothetical protein C0Q70_21147 [Pomacea canaliculata]
MRSGGLAASQWSERSLTTRLSLTVTSRPAEGVVTTSCVTTCPVLPSLVPRNGSGGVTEETARLILKLLPMVTAERRQMKRVARDIIHQPAC